LENTGDRRLRRWRRLDLGCLLLHIGCELRRVWCGTAGRTWTRCRGHDRIFRYTRDFDDLVAFLAQHMAKTPIAALLWIGWDTVGRTIERVVRDLDEDRSAAWLRSA
jgi:transposase